MYKKIILKTMENSIKNNKPIIGVAIGSGFSANQASKGGADFILVLNAGKFRNSGVSSLACLLPFGNSNNMMFEMGEREILTKKLGNPIIFGACASDLTISKDKLIDNIIEAGFHGVNNFPTVGIIDGSYRQALEEDGMGYSEEVELMKKAVQRGLFTIAFVFNEKQSEEMTKVGVDVICAHLGWTLGGDTNVKNRTTLKEDINLVNNIFKASEKHNKNIIKMVYGGKIEDADMAGYFYDNTDAVGYIGGSSFERIPSERIIKSVTHEFKNFNKLNNDKIGFKEMIGQSNSMKELYELIDKVADKNVNIMVTGESGTGKELVVRALHYGGKRRDNPFVKVNCAAMPKDILESELFGHEKGAFTGADKKRIGRFELAHKGTLFLDEIGDMDLSIQAKFLRIIQQQEFERVGGDKTIKVDVRIICATNKDLKKEVKEGRFREDLYYRLNTITLYVPPLRERKEDVPFLIHHFLKEKGKKFDKIAPKISPEVFDALMEYDWPGNVRELENAMERAIILCEKHLIRLNNLPMSIINNNKEFDESKHVTPIDIKETTIRNMEREIIIEALEKYDWNRTKTSKSLGISRRTLYNKIKEFNIR
ncbi:phosphoenolpyruvate hydrolase family protein [Clostridium tetani]|uniref:phosphoenolpyruvate hydrolase family protein n=1 Tax=Clostridium tetani TaxID=1513 RepID=UPI0003C0D72D|nr:phosphoenolpyruvate hydrolase family protein [Clostridium tetani]CDI49935.1 sigma-54 interacting protein [Clostridium tetani 12124569]